MGLGLFAAGRWHRPRRGGVHRLHSHDSTGLSWPGMGKIAEETGFGRTAIIAAIKVLEQGGHLTVRRFRVGKKNVANRYQLPPMGNVSASHPSAPDGLGGSAPDGSELVSKEQVRTHTVRAQVSCEQHARTWYEADGTNCHECARERTRARPEGHRRAIPAGVLRQHAARRAAETETGRPIGWHKGEGAWTRY